MRKSLLALFLLYSIFTTYAQLGLESFEGSFPPAGWGVYDNGVGIVQSWSKSNGSQAQPPHTGSYSAFINLENVSTGLPADWLVTPRFVLPANAQVQFWSRLTQGGNQGSLYELRLSTDATQAALGNYTLVRQWAEYEINPSQLEYGSVVVDIPSNIASPGSQVYVAFVMLGDQGDRWLVDDVQVVSKCEKPTTLGATVTGLDSAMLTWDNPAGVTSWEIENVVAGSSVTGAGQLITTSSGGQVTYAITGLNSGESYNFRVRSACSGTNFSEWSNLYMFTTFIEGQHCLAPIGITSLPYVSASSHMAGQGNYPLGLGTPCGTGSDPGFGTWHTVYRIVPATSSQLTVTVNPDRNDTGVYVFNDCASIGQSCIAGTAALLPLKKTLTFSAQAGEDYYIVVTSSTAVNGYSIVLSAPCTNANLSATFDIVSDCNGGQFSAKASVVLGTAASATIRAIDEYGNESAIPQSINATGEVTFGPYMATETITLVVQNDANTNCSIVSPRLGEHLCPPANDNCVNAVILTGTPPQNNLPATGSLYGATASANIPTCEAGGSSDVWYTFVAVNQKHKIEIENVNGNVLGLSHAVYHGICGNLSLLYCSQENISTATGLVPGQTYYVRIYTEGNQTASTTFNIRTVAYEPSCADDNPLSSHVLELFKNLINHLITQPSIPGQGAGGDGYICEELILLKPYLTDPLPRIYNFTNTGVVTFSFAPHAGTADVVLGPVSPLISEISLVSYQSPEEITALNLLLTNNVNLGEKRYDVRHINFCPDTPCPQVNAQIKVVGAPSCVAPGHVSFYLTNADNVNFVQSWAAYHLNGQLAASATANSPTLNLQSPGDYIVEVVLTGSGGCKTRLHRFLRVSGDCTHCTETNSVSVTVKQLYINLANYLISNYSTTVPPAPFSCQQLVALSPYINVANPKIYNFSNYGGVIRFSFAPSGATQIAIPNNGPIADIDILSYTSASSQSYNTLYNSGTQSELHTIGNIDFCPVVPCPNLLGDIYLASGLSCVQQGQQSIFHFVTPSLNVTGYSWTFYGANGQTVLHTMQNAQTVSYNYTTPGQYNVQVVVTYGSGCTKTFKKRITVTAPGGCTQCTETNPLTTDVKEAYLNLINHLLGYFLNGLPLPVTGQTPYYSCDEIDILAPYISDSNAKVWNATYDNTTHVLKFAFGNHGNMYDVVVTADAPLTNVDLLEYTGQNSFEEPISVRSYINNIPVDDIHTVKHVMFCPEPCPALSGEIKMMSGQSCVSPLTPAIFYFSGPAGTINKYEWTFLDSNGATYAQTTGQFPTLAFAQGNYSIRLTITLTSGCRYTYNGGITVSNDCNTCTEQNPQAASIKSSYRTLLNKLLMAYRSGYTLNNINISSEMAQLAPYITDANPQISNVTYINHTLSFSFSASHSQADVVVYDHGNISAINISAYTSASQSTPVMIVYNNGIVSFNNSMRHLNFCPPEPPCESHIAFVIDESGSIGADEASYIKEQLTEFVNLQKQNNTNLTVTFVAMGDSDLMKGAVATVADINATTNVSPLLNFIANYKLPYGSGANGRSANSDYWYKALQYAYSLHPELIILIADGAQTTNVHQLKQLIQTIQAPQSGTHLYIAALEKGYYIDGQSGNTSVNPNLTGNTSPPGVAMPLTQSLKYLMGLTGTEFPTSGRNEITTKDYYGFENFEYFADALYYFYNEQMLAEIRCGGVAVPVAVCDDCNGFKPLIGKKYWISGWVKQDQTIQVKTYSGCSIHVDFKNQNNSPAGATQNFYTSGDIIDGWQRIAGQFIIPEGTIDIEISLDSGNDLAAYFDDIRIHPSDGSMKTFVYDPETFRLMAEQDDNNYSTFYEYDKEGGLVRIKKETSRGVKTIQESRSGNVIQTNN